MSVLSTLVPRLQPSGPESPSVYAIIFASPRPGVPGGRAATAPSSQGPLCTPSPSCHPGGVSLPSPLLPGSRVGGPSQPAPAQPDQLSEEELKARLGNPGAGRRARPLGQNRPRQGAVCGCGLGTLLPAASGDGGLGSREVPPLSSQVAHDWPETLV